MNKNYEPQKIEKKWQKVWQETELYKTDEDSKKPKFYCLDMFPYPSGAGLHVGHPKGYIATDVFSRMKTHQGYKVLHPMGWDAFGLPTENYAIKNKINPRVAAEENIKKFKEQLAILGFNHDWSREINTTDSEFYKWTQWIFLKLFEKGLAYQSYEPINWCPSCQTGLSMEDLEGGKCERCGGDVEQKPMRQWVLRMTDYADRLLRDLDAVEPAKIPLVKLEHGEDAIRKALPLEERQAVVCIVKHWSENKYLCSRYKKNDWHGFIIGGIEEGEDAGVAGIRETQEESGYQNIRFVKEVGRVDSQFFHQVKNVNRFAHFTGVYLELEDGSSLEIAEHEKALHDVLWLTQEEMLSFLNRDDMKYLWDLFTGKQKQESTRLVDWEDQIIEQQKNWIGRSEGINFKHKVKDLGIEFEVYDSIPQTFMAQTFVIIAPEHKLVPDLIQGTAFENDVSTFVEKIKKKKAANRFDIEKDMEGIFTGRYVENYLGTGVDIPIWVASFALADYGTGIVGCSAHDDRDFAFAKKYNIPLKVVLLPEDKEFAEKVKSLEVFYREPNGILQEPAEFKGMRWDEARKPIIEYIEKHKLGRKAVHYKMRDWVFSRQRYWGEPIPILHCEKCGLVGVPESELPLTLPEVDSYEPSGTGESPLANITEWVNTTCPKCGGKAKRETDTMPQWAGSSWYYLRYIDPKNNQALVDPKKEKEWMPVDLYVGGIEHATRHLLYARFWHKFLYDIGAVSTVEPFKKLIHVGLILAEDGRKMSKRWNNVVNPDDVILEFGADALRLYEMFMGPFTQEVSWSTKGLKGTKRFLDKYFFLASEVSELSNVENADSLIYSSKEIEETALMRTVQKTVKKVEEDIEGFRFNTAVSSMMECLNEMLKIKETLSVADSSKIWRSAVSQFTVILSPFAPHIAEEVWDSLGNKESVFKQSWPIIDPNLLKDEVLNVVIQVNGKVRGTIEAEKDSSEADVVELAKQVKNVNIYLDKKEVIKTIFVKDKILNFIVK